MTRQRKHRLIALIVMLVLVLGAGGYFAYTRLTDRIDDPDTLPMDEATAMYRTVGNIVTIGSYEQDNNLTNGQEPIEWIVLDVRRGRSLLITRYGLDVMAYNQELKEVTWEDCDVRQWLNHDFLQAAFTDAEREVIMTTTVDNSRSQGYQGRAGGNDTEDQLFVLSYAEAMKYFPQRRERKCEPTRYARERGAFENNMASSGWWWLRSPGRDLSYSMCVNLVGTFYHNHVHNAYNFVRPAFWLDWGMDEATEN